MQALDFLNKVADFEGKNLFLLYGEEAYLVDRCREALLAAWNVPFPEMNLTVFQEKVSYADLFGACIQAPCFADLRVIVLEEVDVSEKALRFADILGSSRRRASSSYVSLKSRICARGFIRT